MVRAAQKGEMENPSPEVAEVAATTKRSSVKKFAKTKHKGLPEKKVTKESVKLQLDEISKKSVLSYLNHPKNEGTKARGMEKRKLAMRAYWRASDREEGKDKEPDYKVKYPKEIQKEDYVKELEDGLVKLDYPTYDEVDELMKKIAKDNGIDTTVLHMAFKTKHLMVPDDWAKKKMFEPVMIPKTPKDMECEELNKDDKPFVKKLVGKLRKGSKTHAKPVSYTHLTLPTKRIV